MFALSSLTVFVANFQLLYKYSIHFQNVPDTSSLTSFTIPFNGTTGNDIIVELTPVTGQTPEIEGVSIEVCYTPGTNSSHLLILIFL